MKNLRFAVKANGIPILSQYEIDLIGERLVADYDKRALTQACLLDIDDLAENYLGLEMDYQDLSHNQSILGMMVFEDCRIPIYDSADNKAKLIEVKKGTVLIDNALVADSRRRRERFTIGHEVGHWVLHQRTYSPAPAAVGTYVSCRTWGVERSGCRRLISDEDWLEWQADCFASAVLMPRRVFGREVRMQFKRVGLRPGHYVLGTDVSCDLWLDHLTRELSLMFGVSARSVGIRLQSLKLIRLGPQRGKANE